MALLSEKTILRMKLLNTTKMKKLTTILFLLIGSFGLLQAQKDVSPAILTALQKGDAATLSTYFNTNVELIIGSMNNVYSKKQATGIITDFFRKNKVSSFQILHRGNKDTSAFSICTMKAGNDNYRVYVLVRRTANEQFIQQLRIEPSNE